MINLKVMNAGLNGVLTPSEFMVLYVMNNGIDDNNKWKKFYLEMLSDLTGISTRQLKRIIISLEEKGFIEKRTVQVNNTKKSTIYRLNEDILNQIIDDLTDKTNTKLEENMSQMSHYKENKRNKNNINNTNNNNVTIDTLQVSGVDTPNEDWINSFNDEDWIKYEVERSNTGACDFFNIDSFIEDETSGDAMDNNDLNKENEMSDERTSVMSKKRNEMEQNEDNFKEAIISKAIGNINLDKSSMFYAKSQMEYDVALEDLKVNLKKLQDNTSTEAYNNFRAQLGKWFNASKPYMKFAQTKKKKVNAAPAPTDEEMGKLEWFVEGVKVSKSIEETDKYFKKIDQMFEILYGKYPQNTVDKLYERTTDRLSEYKRNNPIVAEYIKNVTGEPQTTEVEQLPTNEEKTRQDAQKYPQIEEEGNMDMCCECKHQYKVA